MSKAGFLNGLLQWINNSIGTFFYFFFFFFCFTLLVKNSSCELLNFQFFYTHEFWQRTDRLIRRLLPPFQALCESAHFTSLNSTSLTQNCTITETSSSHLCVFPSYYSMFCILVLITIVLHGQNTFSQKCVLLATILLVQVGSNYFLLPRSLYCERYFSLPVFERWERLFSSYLTRYSIIHL